MPLLTTPQISGLAIELLVRSLTLPRTVLRVPGGDLRGPSGGTVLLRVPVPREANEQETPKQSITFNDVVEENLEFDVRHFYDGARVSDEELTLELENFGRQILQPWSPPSPCAPRTSSPKR